MEMVRRQVSSPRLRRQLLCCGGALCGHDVLGYRKHHAEASLQQNPDCLISGSLCSHGTWGNLSHSSYGLRSDGGWSRNDCITDAS